MIAGKCCAALAIEHEMWADAHSRRSLEAPIEYQGEYYRECKITCRDKYVRRIEAPCWCKFFDENDGPDDEMKEVRHRQGPRIDPAHH